jgi:hypothetical protein
MIKTPPQVNAKLFNKRRGFFKYISFCATTLITTKESLSSTVSQLVKIENSEQLTTQNQQIRPFLQVPTIVKEENTVRVFFSPNCPYSYNYFNFFLNLSKSLPKELKFELSPLPNKRDGVEYALAFLAIRRFMPEHTSEFTKSSFKVFQDLGLNSKNWSAIERVTRASNIEVNLPSLVLARKAVLINDLSALIQLTKELRVTNTPCVAVVGTYTVTPEYVSGADPALFNQLVNGVISMALGA